MHTILTTLIDRLDSRAMSGTHVIRWGSPVPSFGDLYNSYIATLGLNPSNREFVDETGKELQGTFRRFHTLKSLGLESWGDADARHLQLILECCQKYFLGNPYDRWFRILENIVTAVGASFYAPRLGACHLDLIPYATSRKWTELTTRQRSSLLNIAADTLGLLLRDSSIRILILNGKSVVEQFENIALVSLDKMDMKDWSLKRSSGSDVTGWAYRGVIDTLSGFHLPERILVLGYNHNLQSSYGVSGQTIRAISSWISQAIEEHIHETSGSRTRPTAQ